MSFYNSNLFGRLALVLTLAGNLTFAIAPLAHATPANHAQLKYNIKEIVTYDSETMEKLVSEAVDSHEASDDVFFAQATDALTDIILVHPRFSEREAGLSQLKGKMDQDEFYDVMRKSAVKLQATLKDPNATPADQASALVALTNWVTEARHMPEEEMKGTLEQIASANIEISDEARDFGREPLENLVSPSEEARLALAK